MSPEHAAAHQIAKYLRAIAHNLPDLSAEGIDAFMPHLKPEDAADYAALLTNKAARLEATAPFEPVTEADKQRVFEEVQDELSDETARDLARSYLDLTEAEWRIEVDDRNEYMQECDQ